LFQEEKAKKYDSETEDKNRNAKTEWENGENESM
jgi:hypothetical protein